VKLVWVGVAAAAVAACGGGRKARPVPRGAGRATAVACAAVRPPGSANARLSSAECKTDADCTTGKNGRCTAISGRVQRNACTYDACTTDADCPAGPCDCDADGNLCATGDCKVDADCGDGGACVGTPANLCFGRSLTFHCTTSGDTCTPDTQDCPNGSKCMFSGEVGHYTCEEIQPCPVG
jgi:hypothetical protein